MFRATILILIVVGGCSSSDSDSKAMPGADASYGYNSRNNINGTNANNTYYSGADAGVAPDEPPPSGEKYGELVENNFIETKTETTSTFSIDVDTASYTIMRRDLQLGSLPAPDSVRVEEHINYFKYDYPQPADVDKAPFSINLELAPSYFGDPGAKLLRIGLQGYEVPESERQPANLVFLIDVSGSMSAQNKLPLVKYALKQLVGKLAPTDTLGIVVYAGAVGAVLQPTSVQDKSMILDALDALKSGGSTNGAGGIKLAYQMAEKAMQPNGINRVVLCTDGDFNVGLTGDALISEIEAYREKGITLTTLGFGMGNLNDNLLEQLADKGNGNYAYIDNQQEVQRVLGEKLVSTLQVIAKDVKIQVEFDPATVAEYRLVGYENRVMENKDFTDDKKDAGEIGAGHSVTAFYELKMATSPSLPDDANDPLVATVRLRFKAPKGTTSRELEQKVTLDQSAASFDDASVDLRFAAAVVELAEILRKSKHSSDARFDDVLDIAKAATAKTDSDVRGEFVELVSTAKSLWP